MKYTLDRFALHVFFFSAALLLFAYGIIVGLYHVYPYRIIADALKGGSQLRANIGGKDVLPWYYQRVRNPYQPVIRGSDQACRGVHLVARLAADKMLIVDVLAMDGQLLHSWTIDWFEIWPKAEHVPARFRPKSRPGGHIHGMLLMENGDLVFNFEHLGLIRLDKRGKVVWRLAYQTHHAIERDDDGNLWVCAQREHAKPSEKFPNRIPPFTEDMILLVSPAGKIVRQWSVPELLLKNGYTGLLYVGTLQPWTTTIKGDVLHLNDAEPFPSRLKEGFFHKGDVLVSMRNNNTVFVFNRNTDKISFVSSGQFIRQHDPDFIDGNTFSVLDNNVAAPEHMRPQSRIAIVSAVDKTVKTFFQGSPEKPFYSIIMGKHQWLSNGNLLITESCVGRAFEINKKGDIVWEYLNFVGSDVIGVLDEVQRLPPEFEKPFRHQSDTHPKKSSPKKIEDGASA